MSPRILAVLGVVFLFQNAAFAAISVNITSPSPGALSGDWLTVRATVTSTYSLQNVTASVADRNAALSFSLSTNRWEGTLSLAGLPKGTHQLTVTAQDIYGSSGSASVTFVKDLRPSINVTAPLPDSVARPLIRVTASCSDDDPAGCQRIAVYIESTPSIEGTTSVDQEISLDAYEGQELQLTFRAWDYAGQSVSVSRRIFVESSGHLAKVEDVPGFITDLSADRILFFDMSTSLLGVRDRASGTDMTLPAIIGRPHEQRHSFLAPQGAIFLADDTADHQSRVYEWRNGALAELGIYDGQLRVSLPYAIWAQYGPKRFFLRDLSLATQLEIPGAGNNSNDVTADGTVAFWKSDYNIYLYKAGVVQKLTDGPTNYWNIYPMTDGTNTVYKQLCLSCPAPLYVRPGNVMLHNASGVTILATFEDEPVWGSDYQVENGWIAFARPDAGKQRQVWLRSVTGQEEQLTFFGTPSRVELLTDDGELTILNLLGRFLKRSEEAPARINSYLGRAFRVDGLWYVAIGRSLFVVSTDITPTTTTVTSSPTPSTQGQSVTFAASVNPPEATGTVVFREGVTNIGAATLSAGLATVSTSSLAPGLHTITAAYGGHDGFGPSTGSVTHRVRYATSVSIDSSVNPSPFGQSVTITAHLSPVTAGTIEFRDGSTLLAAVYQENGTAAYSTSTLSAGNHEITAAFLGSETQAGTTSSALVQQIVAPFGAPQGFVATATDSSHVGLTWLPVTGAYYYIVARSYNNSEFVTIGYSTSTSFTDSGVSPGTTYIYKVRALETSGQSSAYSAVDAATLVMFSDDPPVPSQTVVTATHLLELRTAVNAMRRSAGLSLSSFTDTPEPNVTIKAVHILELRTALDAARAAIGLSSISYADPEITATVTAIKAVHIQQLREGTL